MRSRERARILHVTLKVPELPQTDITYIDNVATLSHWRLRVGSIGHCRA